MKKTAIFFLICSMCISVSGCSTSKAPQTQTSEKQVSGSVKDTEMVSYAEAKVSYLGPEGTYTQEACEKFFNGEGELIPYKTVDEAVAALVGKETDYAVIPQENTIGGAVIDYVDTVIAQTDVSIIGEVELPISQNLLTLPDTELGDIKTVYSHKQGIAQGKEFIEKNLPDAEVIEVSSTAEGAKTVSQSSDKNAAAIASAGCADVYGLKILAANIQNNDLNKTRFYVLSADKATGNDKERLAFIASGAAADLPKLMSRIESEGAVLVTIHDRPEKTELGRYNYIIECSDCSYDAYEKITETDGFDYRFLGCFDSF